MNQVLVNAISGLLLFVVTGLLVWVTYLLKQATALQYVSAMIIGFQNEWHSRRAILMRDYLHSVKFKDLLQQAIGAAYALQISYKDIESLLERSKLKPNVSDVQRLQSFEDILRNAIENDPVSKNPFFSAYEALIEVLLCFDRLAVLQNSPNVQNFVVKYRPPIRDLSHILQAFIAVRLVLREDNLKNYKKDYILLLHSLGLDNQKLFDICNEGLKKRREWSKGEARRSAKIRKRFVCKQCGSAG